MSFHACLQIFVFSSNFFQAQNIFCNVELFKFNFQIK